MTTKAEDIRRRMMEVRDEIDDDVEGLVDGAKSLLDWRDYVRNQPLVSVGVACAIGAFLVPSAKREIRTDASTVAKMLKNEKLVVAPGAQVKQSSLMGALFTTAAGIAMRAVAAGVTQRASAALAIKEAEKTEQSSSHANSRRSG